MTYFNYIVVGNYGWEADSERCPKLYRPGTKRFCQSWKAFPPNADHQLVVIDNNHGFDDEMWSWFDGIKYEVLHYDGGGWDTGAHQFFSYHVPPHEWMMCFSTWAHFKEKDWFTAFVKAREQYGDTLYGSTCSPENGFHIRGTGFMCKAIHVQHYPTVVSNRTLSRQFESGPTCLTARLQELGNVYIVTKSGVHLPESALELANGFRRGDQSDLLTFDKYTDLYENGCLFQGDAS